MHGVHTPESIPRILLNYRGNSSRLHAISRTQSRHNLVHSTKINLDAPADVSSKPQDLPACACMHSTEVPGPQRTYTESQVTDP